MSMRTFTIATMSAALLALGAAVFAQTIHDHPAPPATTAAAQQPAMDHQKMMADMQAQQKTLDDLVAAMNAATGPEKVDRIAAVVNEMAAMHKRMTTMMMQGGMMQGGMMQMRH